jgi:AcrR family transcriptional regulator
MSRRKLTESELEAMFADYDAWNQFDPEAESADDVAARHGVSKQTMYQHLKRRQTARAAEAQREAASTQIDLEPVVRYLTEELVRARMDREALAEQLRDLQAQMTRDHDDLRARREGQSPQSQD